VWNDDYGRSTICRDLNDKSLEVLHPMYLYIGNPNEDLPTCTVTTALHSEIGRTSRRIAAAVNYGSHWILK